MYPNRSSHSALSISMAPLGQVEAPASDRSVPACSPRAGVVQELPALVLARRVANLAGAAADKRDRAVPSPLQMAEHHDADQMPDVQAVGRAVVADVAGEGLVAASASRPSGSVHWWMKPRASNVQQLHSLVSAEAAHLQGRVGAPAPAGARRASVVVEVGLAGLLELLDVVVEVVVRVLEAVVVDRDAALLQPAC